MSSDMQDKDNSESIIFHYPPDLLSLLIEALPRLCKTKKDLLLFFRGAGVSYGVLSPYEMLLRKDRESFKKPIVAREILAKLNELGEGSLRERRELLKRVVEFQDFSVCWESDQAAARGFIAQIRELVNIKDSFTRMNMERELERKQRIAEEKRRTEDVRKRQQEIQEIKRNFFALFAESNPHKRGKAIEAVLNCYFKFSGISVSEAITLKGESGEGVIEQIDGVVQIRGQLFLVEVKWEQETLGREKVAPHLVRIFSRGLAGGIFISYSDYSPSAIIDCKEALREKVIVLCKLDELIRALEQEANLTEILHSKIDAAVIHKNPLFLTTL